LFSNEDVLKVSHILVSTRKVKGFLSVKGRSLSGVKNLRGRKDVVIRRKVRKVRIISVRCRGDVGDHPWGRVSEYVVKVSQ